MARPHLPHVSAQLLVSPSLGFGGEEFFSLCDETFLLGSGQSQDVFCAFGQLVVDHSSGGSQDFFQFGFAEDVPVFERDPMGAGQVGGGDDAFDLEQFMESFRRGGERQRSLGKTGATGIVKVDEGEHLAADGLFADPEDEVVAPLARFDCVGEAEKVSADAFSVDSFSPSGRDVPSSSFISKSGYGNNSRKVPQNKLVTGMSEANSAASCLFFCLYCSEQTCQRYSPLVE